MQAAMQSIAHPRTLGGYADLRKLQLEPHHLSQSDKSLNSALWSFFPIDGNVARPTAREFTQTESQIVGCVGRLHF